MMKKLLLLTLAAGSILSASAQKNVKSLSIHQQTRTKPTAPIKAKKQNFSHLAKTTSTPFATESFGSGTPTTLPAGWSTANLSGAGAWRWTPGASTGGFSLGALNSTTAADGWMILDSDSIGAANSTLTTFSSYLQSPPYSCIGHSTVVLSFEQYFVKFNDSCLVQVSTDGGNTFTSFALPENNNIASNSGLDANATTTRVDITSVAANQPDVIIRFFYKYESPSVTGGGFNWLVDDVALSELDPLDFSIDGSAALMNTGFGFTSIGEIPVQLLDTILPVTAVSNDGTDAPAAGDVSVKIFRNGTQTFTATSTLNDLASGVQDSLVVFDVYPASGAGTYIAAFENLLGSDGISDGNVDSVAFLVSDSIYHRIGNGSLTLNAGFFVHRPAGGGDPASDSKIATLFDIPVGKSDTLTAVSVAFTDFTEAGATPIVIISKLNDQGDFTEVARTPAKTLTAANISSATAAQFAYFPIESTDPFIMDEGRYAVAVVGSATDPDLQLAVAAGEVASGFVASIQGLAVAGNNDAQGIDAADGANLEALNFDAPLMLLHFGKRVAVSVKDVTSIAGLDAYPNPATNNVTVSFQLKNDAAANISVTNAVGQIVKTVNVGKVNANQQKDVTISTANMANGVYFYTVKANGEKLTKRIVISK